MIAARRLQVVSFNEGLPVSGITSWGLRVAATFADDPSLGIDWYGVEIGEPDNLDAVATLLPANLRNRFTFVPRTPDENRWNVARRAIRACPHAAEADVVLPNHCAEGWLAAALARQSGSGPAVVGVIHSDVGRFYAACGTRVTPLEAVVAVSRRCCQEFARLCPDRPMAVYVPYGVPVVAMTADPPPPLKVAYFGRLEVAQKRVLDLIPMAERLVARGVTFELNIAGEGADADALREGLDRVAAGRVRFHGRLPLGSVGSFLGGQHVFVSVSEFEGTSIAMLEAMGRGLVPVVTDVSGVRDVIEPGENGWVVPVGDIDSLVDQLAALSADPAGLARAGAAARHSVDQCYSLPGSARSLAVVCREAAAAPRRPLRLKRGHPALGVFDRRWLPNGASVVLRRLARRLTGGPTR